ncbi:LuxR family transcriptional regulator [Bradyrhizobium sp. UFLA05-112]
MHRVFQEFTDLLALAEDSQDFCSAMSGPAAALDLSCFAYLALPRRPQERPCLISTYPSKWTSHYLRNNYQSIDPVIEKALRTDDPFRWGVGLSSRFTLTQQQLFEEAAEFGIRYGFTIPIHDNHGPVAALTFATDARHAKFEACINSQEHLLQLLAISFDAHVRRKLMRAREINGIKLSAREYECVEWAAQGKTTWEIGRILGISHHTVASYLNNAKKKLGVRTVIQSAVRFAAARKRERK